MQAVWSMLETDCEVGYEHPNCQNKYKHVISDNGWQNMAPGPNSIRHLVL